MIKWIRPSGNPIETGDTDELIGYAIDNGWKQADKPKPESNKKTQKEAANASKKSSSKKSSSKKSSSKKEGC